MHNAGSGKYDPLFFFVKPQNLSLQIFSFTLFLSVFADVRDLYQNQDSRLLSPFGNRPPFAVNPGPAIKFETHHPGQEIAILRQEQSVEPDGSYKWA